MPLRSLTLSLVLVVAALPAAAGASSIEGTWEWVRTEYAGGTTVTPADVGYSEQCCFCADNVFIHYIDEQFSWQGTWATGEMIIGACTVEAVTVEGQTWIWTIATDDPGYLTLQTGFECPLGGGSPVTEAATLVARGPVSTDARSWGQIKSLFR